MVHGSLVPGSLQWCSPCHGPWVFPVDEVGSVPWSLGPCHDAGEVCAVVFG